MRNISVYVIRIFVLVFLLLPQMADAKSDRLKPLWIKKAPESFSPNVAIVPVIVYSTDSQALPAKALSALTYKLPSDWNVSTSVTSADTDSVELSLRKIGGESVHAGKINVTADGGNVAVKCALIDEYQDSKYGMLRYHALYQVAKTEDTSFLETFLTHEYGAKKAVLSIVPGLGQFSKGDQLKGGLFLGGCAAGAVGVVITESQRKAYISQMSQTHDANILRQLDARQKNMGIARNVCLGATAAIYLWNLIDAAVAPGARRVVITGNSIKYNF